MPGASPAYCCRRATRRWHSRLLRADAVDDAVNNELALAVDGQDRDWQIRTITRLRVDRDRPRCPEQSIRFEDCLRRCLHANRVARSDCCGECVDRVVRKCSPRAWRLTKQLGEVLDEASALGLPNCCGVGTPLNVQRALAAMPASVIKPASWFASPMKQRLGLPFAAPAVPT